MGVLIVHEPGSSGRGVTLVATLLTVSAVFGATLLLLPTGVDAPDGETRFAAAESSVLCPPSNLGNPVAASSDSAREVHVDVDCEGDLPTRLAVSVAGDDRSRLYRIDFSPAGEATLVTPFQERNLPHVTRGDLEVLSPDQATYEWVLTTAEGDTLSSSTDDPLGDSPSEAEACTPQQEVVCVDADEGVTVVVPPPPGDPAGGEASQVGDLLAAVEGDVSDLQDGGVSDVTEGRVCPGGADLVAGSPASDDASDLEAACLLVLERVDDELAAVLGAAETVREEVDAVAYADKRFTAKADGETVLEVTIPNPQDVPTREPGVAVRGQGPCTYVTDTVTLAMDGEEADPCGGDPTGAEVTGDDGEVAAAVERVGEGRYRVGTPVSSATLDAAALRVVADPADGETALELVTAAGETAATVTVTDPGSRLAPDHTEVHVSRAVEDATGLHVTKVVSGLLAVEDEDDDGTPERAAAYPAQPAGAGNLGIAYENGTWRARTPAGSAAVDGATLDVAPEAGTPNRIQVVLRDDDGDATARFTVHGGSTPTTAAYAVDGVGSGSVSPPVAVAGPPTDPASVAVSGPEGQPLLVYQESGSEATLEVPPADESRTVDRETVRIRGHPLEDREWSLVVQGPGGDGLVRHTVNRPNHAALVHEAHRQAPGDLGPVVSVVGGLPETGEEVQFLERIADGEQAHTAQDPLDGHRWVSGIRPLTFEAAFDDPEVYDRFYVRYAAAEEVPLDAPTVPLPAEGDDERNRSGTVALANTSASWDDQVLRFEVVAERRVGDGLVAYARVDNRTDEPYAVRVDASTPSAQVQAPSDPDGTTWLVDWSGQDAASGVSEYDLQKKVGAGDWADLLMRTTGTSQQVTGLEGVDYRFRVRATDAVGHAGDWVVSDVTRYDAPEEETDPVGGDDGGDDGGSNAAPTVDVLSPEGGIEVSNIVEVGWAAADPDGTAPAVNVYVRQTGETEWRPLRTNTDRAYWDTTERENGRYDVKVVADDGSLSSQAVVEDLVVDNEVVSSTPGAGGPSPGASDGGADDAPPDGEGGTQGGSDGPLGVPAPSPAATAAALLAAAAARRRR